MLMVQYTYLNSDFNVVFILCLSERQQWTTTKHNKDITSLCNSFIVLATYVYIGLIVYDELHIIHKTKQTYHKKNCFISCTSKLIWTITRIKENPVLKDHLDQSPLWIVHIHFICVIRPLLLRDNAFLPAEWWSLKTVALYTEFVFKTSKLKVKVFTEHWLRVLVIYSFSRPNHGTHVLVKYQYAHYFLSKNLQTLHRTNVRYPC